MEGNISSHVNMQLHLHVDDRKHTI